MTVTPHPSEEDVLFWCLGRLEGGESRKFEEHARDCVECGASVNAASSLVDAVAVCDSTEFQPPMEEPEPSLPTTTYCSDTDVTEIFSSHPDAWVPALEAHAGSQDSEDFFSLVANRAATVAATEPDGVLRIVALLRDQSSRFSGRSDRSEFLGRVALVEGMVYRTKGEWLRALTVFKAGEAQLEMPLLSFEGPRLHLAIATALHSLDRLEEAEKHAALSRQGFWRCGQETSIAKCWWLDAHIAWSRDDPRKMFRRAKKAFRMLRREKDPQASLLLILIDIAASLVGRQGLARRLLAVLEEDPVVQESRYESARLGWVRGLIELQAQNYDDAYVCFDRAAEAFAALDVPYTAARYKLDAAHVAGLMGAGALQLDAAAVAATILSKIPGHEGETALALQSLREALATHQRIAEAVTRVRGRLRPM